MNAITRQEKLSAIKDGDQMPVGKRTIRFRGESKDMDVYEIPLEYLVYNKYNGRILSRTKTLETQGVTIDPGTDDGKEKIEKLLWDSKIDKNRKTEKDLEQYGQQEPGIVTLDGVIIDGNRRAMLLNKIGKTHFRAIILDVRIDEDRKEIERLETTYQMGADEKQDYNPIEKYLKVNEMRELGFSYSEIAECMGENVGEIEKMHRVYETMMEYLSYLGYDGIYTALDGREDQLIHVADWRKKYEGGQSNTGFDGYTDADVNDLIMIAFDYVRDKKEGKEFRLLADGNKGNNFFSNEEVWRQFRDTHFGRVMPISEEEPPIDATSEHIEEELKARDSEWQKRVDAILKEEWGKASEQLEFAQNSDRPGKLLERARDALDNIDPNNPNLNHSMMGIVKEINQKSYELKKVLERIG
jgi:ParB-like chromosome segregation protein Spo0J